MAKMSEEVVGYLIDGLHHSVVTSLNSNTVVWSETAHRKVVGFACKVSTTGTIAEWNFRKGVTVDTPTDSDVLFPILANPGESFRDMFPPGVNASELMVHVVSGSGEITFFYRDKAT